MGFWQDMAANASGGYQYFKDNAFGAVPDYQAKDAERARLEAEAVDQQTRDNRPTQYTPFGSSEWIQDANGNWTQRVSLNPAEQQKLDANRAFGMNLMSQGQGLLGQGLNLNGLPGLSSGDDARNRAEEALFGRMSARLDPMWAKRGEGLRTQLINQGLDPSSEAFKSAMSDFSSQRNDAYSSAMNDAITMGGNEASRIFGMDLSRRGQMFNERVGDHNAGLQNMGMGLNIYGATQTGMPQMPGFASAGMARPQDPLAAAALTQQGVQGQNASAQELWTLPFSVVSGGASIGSGLGRMPSSAPQQPGGYQPPYPGYIPGTTL